MKWGLSSNRSSILSPSLKRGESRCRLHRTGWGTLPVSVFGPNSEFGFEDLSLEGFHNQIILEMLSQALGFEIFLLLNHNFNLFSALVHSHCLWSSFAGCSQGPTERLSSSGSPPWELVLTSYQSFLESVYLHEPQWCFKRCPASSTSFYNLVTF